MNFRGLQCALIAAMLAVGTQTTQAATYYVDASKADDAGDGLSWANAKQTVAAAYTAAAATGDAIWIKAGEYTGVAITLNAAKAVSIYGSFAGTETAIGERAKAPGSKPWEFVNQTTLKGATVITISGVGTATVDGVDIASNGSAGRGVQCAANYANSAYKIQNCVVRDFNSGGDGGGINTRSTGVEIAYCLITNNTGGKGGGAYLDYALLHHCEITNNSAAIGDYACAGNVNGGGGGLIIAATAASTVHSCLITGNKATHGGGVFMSNASAITVYNCVIVGDTASRDGGGVAFDNRSSSMGLIYNSTIANNVVTETGGGGLYISANTTNQKVYNSILLGNKNITDNAVVNVHAEVAGTFVNNIVDKADIANLVQTNCVISSDGSAIFDGATWALKAGSLAIDAGLGTIPSVTLPTTDYAGHGRVKGTAIDIGAYEYAVPPAAPTSLQFAPTTTTIVVQWTASVTEGLAGYNIYLNGAKQNTTLVAEITYTITGLTLGTAYTVAVEAVDGDGLVSTQLSGTVTTLSSADAVAPTWPLGQNLQVVAFTQTSISVAYGMPSDNVGIVGVHIYANGVLKGTTVEQTYTITGLTPGTQYIVEAKAFDASGNESVSDAPAVTTLAANVPVVYYVRPSGSTSEWTGKNSYFIYDNVKTAITAAAATGEVSQLWVAAGTYPSLSLEMVNGISLYGGFAGTENTLTDRVKGSKAWDYTNVTVLQGESPAYVSANTNAIGSLAVIKQNIVATSPIVVDGFTLTNGEHGVLFVSGSGTTVRNCIITNNGTLPTGVSGIDGGGVAIRAGSFKVEYCLISNNKAKSGGGVINAGATGSTIEFCTISGNKGLTIGTNWDFLLNSVSYIHGWGGGVFIQGGAVNSCIITGNEALAGGGVLVRDNNTQINNCIIEGNSAIFGGGITYDKRSANAGTNKKVFNCLILNNTTGLKPDFVSGTVSPEASYGEGASVYFTNADQRVINSILIGNANGNGDPAPVSSEMAEVRGALTSCYVDLEADTLGGNTLHPASENLYDADWRPKAGFPGVDIGLSGNASLRDIAGYPRVKGNGIDIGPYEQHEQPNAPTNLNLLEDKTEVTLSWTASPDLDVTRYAIYASLGTTGDATTLVTDTVTRTTYTVTGLAMGTDYVFTVRGVDEVGQNTPALSGTIATLNENTPNKPQNLVATPDDNSVLLTWDAAGEKANKYIVYLNGTLLTDTISASSSPTYTVTGLNPYTVYSFFVIAKNTTGTGYESRPSSTVSTRTTDKTAPAGAPSALAQTGSTRTTVSVAWTAAIDNVGIRFYQIYWDGVVVDSTRTNATTYTRGGLPANTSTSYQVYVVGVDSSGNISAASNTVSVTTGTIEDQPIWFVGTWATKPNTRVFATFADAQYDITLVTGDTTRSEIWVQGGNYSITANIVVHGKATSFYGGFAGNENSRGERAKVSGGFGWEFVNPTILKQDASVNVFHASMSTAPFADTVEIDGFTIIGNNSNTRGVYVGGSGSNDGVYPITIRNCDISYFGVEGSGSVGGGTDGPAIGLRDYISPGYIDSCYIHHNIGNNGGGVYMANATNCNIRVMSNSYVMYNETGIANTNGNPDNITGAPANWGGGVFANTATVRSCYVANNRSVGGGGVVFRTNGSKVENCIVVNNEASYGGGGLFHQSVTEGLMTNNTFANNTAVINGGGVYATDNGQQVMNNIFFKNRNTTQNITQSLGHTSQKEPKLFNNVVSDQDIIRGTEAVVLSESADKSELFDNTYDGWHSKLSDTSKLYDAGTLEVVGFEMPTLDYTGAKRIVGGRIDIGPFEFQGDQDAPTTPTGLAAVPSESTIVLSWTASQISDSTSSAIVAGYNLYVNRVLWNTTELITGTTYTLTGLDPWTTYTIQLAAVGSTGSVSPRTPETFTSRTTDASAPTEPTGLATTEVTELVIAVQWNPSTDNVAVTGYEIYLNGNLDRTNAATAYTHRFTYLDANTEYLVEVLAFDAAGNKSTKASLSVTTLGGGGTTDPTSVASSSLPALQVYPNPVVDGQLIINNEQLKAGEKVEIYTLAGTLVAVNYIAAGQQTTLNISALESGVYVVKAGKRSAKIVKN